MSKTVIIPNLNKHKDETCDQDQSILGMNEVKKIRVQYSLKEVACHDSWDDCWVIIYDRVYDITKFLELVRI